MYYSQNPSLHYLRISDDEVVVKGSHLEGFSLLVSDEELRGFAGDLIATLTEPVSVEAAQAAVASTGVLVDDVQKMLDDLADAGAVIRHAERTAAVSDWIAFLRYGVLDPAVQRHPIVCVGGDVAQHVVKSLSELGLAAEYRPNIAATDVAAFAVPDVSMNVAEMSSDVTSNSSMQLTEDDLPDDDLPRLAMVVEGAPLATLYKLNEMAMEHGVPIFYAQVAGSDYAIGPHVVPGATACFWEFERQRSRSLFSYSEYAFLAASGGAVTTPTVSRAAMEAAVVPHLVELALLGRSMLAGRVLRGRATTGETSKHSVMRLPRCPVCLTHRPILRNLLY